MKILFRIFLVLAVILAIVYFSLWGFINIKGKALLREKVREFTSKDIFIDSLDFSPPLGVNIRNLSSDNMNAGRVNASLDPLMMITGRIGFNTVLIRDASFGIVKKDDQILAPVVPLPVIPKGSSGASGSAVEKKDLQEMIPVFIKHLILENVTIDFNDKSQGVDFQGSLCDVNADVYNLSFPLGSRTFFNLSSTLKIADLLLEDNVLIKGWIDFATKSMDAQLNIREIPYESFSVYYPPFWQPDNLGIQEANLSLDTNFNALNNDLIIKGKISLPHYKFKDSEKESTKVSITKGILERFKGGKAYPGFEFEIPTKFDNPRIDFSTITAQVKTNISGIAITFLIRTCVTFAPGGTVFLLQAS